VDAERLTMVYHGRVKDGTIVLDSGVELPDGAEVLVELDSTRESHVSSGPDPLTRMTDLAVETGIPDLATNFDAYANAGTHAAPLPRGASIDDLLSVAGTLDDQAAREMMQAIEEGCERVDLDEW
jgi:hypothetical protein